MNIDHTADVAIIGGGVIGSAIAYFLGKLGVRATVIERAEIAAESSSAAAGLLAPLGALDGPGPFTDLIQASRTLIFALIPELEDLSGEQMEYRRLGSLRVASDEHEVRLLHEKMEVWRRLGWQVDWLTDREALQQAACLTEAVAGAVFASQEGSIKPAGVTRAYAGAARRLGAHFIEQAEVIAIETKGTRVTGLRTSAGQYIACGQLVLAAGAWSAQLGSWLKLAIPVQAARGQILALGQPEVPLERILFGQGVYLVPKPDGTIFVGATVEHVGFVRTVTAAGIAWLLSSALKLAQGLSAAPLERFWAGLRPWSKDGWPILDRAPGWENVVLATGHSGVGFETSAISGHCIAELLTTGQVPELIRSFGYARFA